MSDLISCQRYVSSSIKPYCFFVNRVLARTYIVLPTISFQFDSSASYNTVFLNEETKIPFYDVSRQCSFRKTFSYICTYESSRYSNNSANISACILLVVTTAITQALPIFKCLLFVIILICWDQSRERSGPCGYIFFSLLPGITSWCVMTSFTAYSDI